MVSAVEPPVADPRKHEIERNYRALVALLPSLLAANRGKFALMRDGAIKEFYDTARDAFLAGQQAYADGLFSVQEVTNSPVDLGHFSHAISSVTAMLIRMLPTFRRRTVESPKACDIIAL